MKKSFAVILILVMSVTGTPVIAITSSQKNAIKDHCSTIKENLVNLQHTDSRARVYLGRYFETILNKYIVPLNLRLVENNTSDSELMENQSNFSTMREKFINDYIDYQKDLENLVAINCADEPEKFYEKLVSTRGKRKVVSQDVVKLKTLAGKQMNLVKSLKEKMK